MRLIGTSGSSGELQLAPEMSVYSVFQPDTVDEFAITCPDIGDLQEIEIIQGGNGHDWSSSRWKLEKVEVTCLQSLRIPATMDARDVQSTKTLAPLWVFRPRTKWLGVTPKGSEERKWEEKLKKASEEALHIEVANVLKPNGLKINVAGNSFIVNKKTITPPAITPCLTMGKVKDFNT